MKITTHLDYQTILANQPRPVYFALQLEASDAGAARPTAAAFCFVLDRSGSMNGKPLEGAKAAAQVPLPFLWRVIQTIGNIAPCHIWKGPSPSQSKRTAARRTRAASPTSCTPCA